jgi:hypothetical protein
MGQSPSAPSVEVASAPAAEPGAPLPRLTDASGEADASTNLLDRAAIDVLKARMPYEQRQRWRLLFDSREHGQSFNRFLKHVLVQGPTLIVVRDTRGNVFGGFASESWKCGPRFAGSYSCFLFNVAPTLQVHTASGDNNSFMYINEGKEEVPNGVAFGGKHFHFGLWLHAGLDTGESSGLCSTFDGQLFDAPQKFDVDTVEVWATADPKGPVRLLEDDEPQGEANTVLHRRREEVNFMSMAGNRSMASDNI